MDRLSRTLMLSLSLCTLVGCGETLYKVKGKVTFEGKPMAGGGSIAFIPTGNERIRSAGGEINEDGTFELTTNKTGDGAMAGDYRVAINQTTETEPKNMGDDGQPVRIKGVSLPKEDRIPTEYADHYNSPLTAKVEAKSPNEINFPLKRK